jgi:hypothetical protein
MIGTMQSLREDDDLLEARSKADERLGGEPGVPPAVGELTVRELDLQRRLVRESLLLRPV